MRWITLSISVLAAASLSSGQGCDSFGFSPFYPKMLNGSETETRVSMVVSLTSSATVTCAAFFIPTGGGGGTPTPELIFQPVVDPFIPPEDRVNVYAVDPMGAYYLSRSAPIEFNGNTSSSTTVDVFVSNLQSGGVRTFQVFCAAECAADGNVTIVSDPTVVTLFTFPGTSSFYFSGQQMNDLGKLFTSTGEEQDDGSWEFSQLGQPLSFTELTALVDLPLGIKAYQDVDLTMNFPIGLADAIFSTYLIGLTDGATVWCLSISPTSVRAIQWPFLIPFEADFTQTALLFGRWSGPSQTSTFFKIRYQCSRASGTFVVTYTRGTVTAVFSMSSPRAASIGGPLRLVVFSTSQGAKYSFFSVYGTVTVANYALQNTFSAYYDPDTLAVSAYGSEVYRKTVQNQDKTILYTTNASDRVVFQLPLPEPILGLPLNLTSGIDFQVVVTIADGTSGGLPNTASIGLANGTTAWTAQRTPSFVSGQLVNTAAHSDVLVGISATNAGDTTPTFQATISYQGGWLSGSAIASWGYTSWNYGYTSGSAPLSVIALSGNTAIVQHYITFTRVEVTRADVFPPTVTLRTLTDQIIAPVATNATSIPIFITFSEEIRIVGSGTTLLHTVNCTASAVVYTSGLTTSELNVTLYPLHDGFFTATVLPGAVVDKAGNPNTTPSNTLTFKRDTVGPYETISIAAPLFASARTLGRNGAWNVTILISKQPRFFFAEYVSAINAVLTGFQSEPQLDAILAPNTSTVVYTMLCSPSGQGPVNVSIAAGQYQDLANNVNHNATVGLIYDSIPPALNLTTEHPPISNLTVALFTLVITEHVISFTSSNITVVNGVAHNLTLLWCDSGPWTGQGECTYEFLVAPAADGIVTVTLLAGAILDFALNPSLPSVHISFRFDDITLTSFLESQTLPLTNTVLPFSITFSETPFFLDIASFTCRNCTISNLVQVSTVYNTSFTDIYAPDPPAVFTFTVTPVSTLCDIAVYLDGLGVTDRALNGVSQSNSFQFQYDAIPPVVVLESDTPINANEFTVQPVYARWSKKIQHFDVKDITVVQATVTSLLQPNETEDPLFYVFTVAPFNPGPAILSDVHISVQPAATLDYAGNGNELSYNGTVNKTSAREIRFQFHLLLPKTFDFVPIMLLCVAGVTIILVPVIYFSFIVLRLRHYHKRGVFLDPMEALTASSSKVTKALRNNIVLLESYPSPFIISVHAPELLAERKAAEDKKKRRLARREARRAKREEEEKADKEAKRALGGKGGKGKPAAKVARPKPGRRLMGKKAVAAAEAAGGEPAQ